MSINAGQSQRVGSSAWYMGNDNPPSPTGFTRDTVRWLGSAGVNGEKDDNRNCESVLRAFVCVAEIGKTKTVSTSQVPYTRPLRVTGDEARFLYTECMNFFRPGEVKDSLCILRKVVINVESGNLEISGW